MELNEVSVQDCILKNIETINENELISKAGGKFKKGIRVLLVVDDYGVYKGTLDEKKIIVSRLNPNTTKIKAFVNKTPQLREEDDIFKAVRFMLEEDVKSVPVANKEGTIIGEVTDNSVLALVIRTPVGKEKISDLMSRDVVCFNYDTTISQALSKFKRENFSHAPVLGKNKKLEGIITKHDILEKAGFPAKKVGNTERVTEKISSLNSSIVDMVNSQPITLLPQNTVRECVQEMIKKEISAVIVKNIEGKVEGIITKNDVWKRVVEEGKKIADFEFTFAKGEELDRIDEYDLVAIKTDVARLMEKYKEMLGASKVVVYIKRHKENIKKQHLYHIRVRIDSEHGLFTAHSSGVGINGATHKTLEKLKKQLKKYKDIHMWKTTKSRSGKARKR